MVYCPELRSQWTSILKWSTSADYSGTLLVAVVTNTHSRPYFSIRVIKPTVNGFLCLLFITRPVMAERITREDALSREGFRHACHIMLYGDSSAKLFGKIPIKHIVLVRRTALAVTFI